MNNYRDEMHVYLQGEWVCVARWVHKSELWYKQGMKNPFEGDHLNHATSVKLIHEKDEEVLDKYLSHKSNTLYMNGEILKEDFIDTYDPSNSYSLDGSDNAIRIHGFEIPDFEYNILQTKSEKLHLEIKTKVGWQIFQYDENGRASVGIEYVPQFNLKLYKKYWYEHEKNFPCLVVKKEDREPVGVAYSYDGKIFRNRYSEPITCMSQIERANKKDFEQIKSRRVNDKREKRTVK